MSKQIYVDAKDDAGELALDYVLSHTAPEKASSIQAAILLAPKGSYKDIDIHLSRQYKTFEQSGDKEAAEATANAIAYFAMRSKFEDAQKNNVTGIDDVSIDSVRRDAKRTADNYSNAADRYDTAVATEHRTEQNREHAAEVKAQAAAHAAEVQQQEAARVAALSPRDKAIEDVVGKDKPELQGQVREALDTFKGKGRSADELRVNLRNDMADKPPGLFNGHDARSLALQVLNRQESIENGTAAIQTAWGYSEAPVMATAAIPSLGLVSAAAAAEVPPVAAAPAPEVPPVAAAPEAPAPDAPPTSATPETPAPEVPPVAATPEAPAPDAPPTAAAPETPAPEVPPTAAAPEAPAPDVPPTAATPTEPPPGEGATAAAPEAPAPDAPQTAAAPEVPLIRAPQGPNKHRPQPPVHHDRPGYIKHMQELLEANGFHAGNSGKRDKATQEEIKKAEDTLKVHSEKKLMAKLTDLDEQQVTDQLNKHSAQSGTPPATPAPEEKQKPLYDASKYNPNQPSALSPVPAPAAAGSAGTESPGFFARIGSAVDHAAHSVGELVPTVVPAKESSPGNGNNR